MLYSVFILGGAYFWLLVFAFALFMVYALDHDNFTTATFITVGMFVLLALFSNLNPIGYVINHPLTSILLVVGYFVLGAFWALFKWYFFVLNASIEYAKHRNDVLNGQDILDLSPAEKDEFLSRIRRRMPVKYGHSFPLQAAQNKSRFLGWAIYWPFSGIWTLINDPIKHIGNWMFLKLHDTMQVISNKVFQSKFTEFR